MSVPGKAAQQIKYTLSKTTYLQSLLRTGSKSVEPTIRAAKPPSKTVAFLNSKQLLSAFRARTTSQTTLPVNSRTSLKRLDVKRFAPMPKSSTNEVKLSTTKLKRPAPPKISTTPKAKEKVEQPRPVQTQTKIESSVDPTTKESKTQTTERQPTPPPRKKRTSTQEAKPTTPVKQFQPPEGPPLPTEKSKVTLQSTNPKHDETTPPTLKESTVEQDSLSTQIEKEFQEIAQILKDRTDAPTVPKTTAPTRPTTQPTKSTAQQETHNVSDDLQPLMSELREKQGVPVRKASVVPERKETTPTKTSQPDVPSKPPKLTKQQLADQAKSDDAKLTKIKEKKWPRATTKPTGTAPSRPLPTTIAKLHEEALDALKKDDLHELQTLIQKGLPINSKGKNSLPLLREAEKTNAMNCAGLLIELGADLIIPDLGMSEEQIISSYNEDNCLLEIPEKETNNVQSLLASAIKHKKESKEVLKKQLKNEQVRGAQDYTHKVSRTTATGTQETINGETVLTNVVETTKSASATTSSDTHHFLRAMSEKLLTDEKNIPARKYPALRYSLQNSEQTSRAIKTSQKYAHSKEEAERNISHELEQFFGNSPVGNPTLTLVNFGSSKHHVAIGLTRDDQGNTAVAICNRGERGSNTPPVVIRTIANEDVPPFLIKLNALKELQEESLVVIHSIYKTLEQIPETQSEQLTAKTEDFPFTDQQAKNCGRASTSAVLRYACSLEDMSSATSKKAKEKRPAGPFKAFKRLHASLLEDFKTKKESFKEVSATLDQLSENILHLPEEEIIQSIQTWMANILQRRDIPQYKKLNYLRKINEQMMPILVSRFQLLIQRLQIENDAAYDASVEYNAKIQKLNIEYLAICKNEIPYSSEEERQILEEKRDDFDKKAKSRYIESERLAKETQVTCARLDKADELRPKLEMLHKVLEDNIETLESILGM